MFDPQTTNPAISPVVLEAGEITVDAEFVARGLGLSSKALKGLMQNGLVVARSEIGVGDDRGHFRLTFRYQHRTWWTIVSDDGAVVESSQPLSEIRISLDSIAVKSGGTGNKASRSSLNASGRRERVE